MAQAILKYVAGIIKRYSSTVALTSGDVAVVGNRIGIVSGTESIAIGDDYTLQTIGIFTVAAKSADTWSDGDLLYRDDTNNYLTTTSTSNKSAGLADGAKAAGATTAVCDINASVASGTV